MQTLKTKTHLPLDVSRADISLQNKSAAIYVVIPVYNSKAYLHRCIDSFRNCDFQVVLR